MIVTMIHTNIADAKARLSEFLDRAAAGETVVICKRNVPVAELRAIPPARAGRRTFGGYRGEITIHPGFFDPLPDDELALWEGRG